MDNLPLSKLFAITKRFQRSVHLERDFYPANGNASDENQNALDGYIVTITARETLRRLLSAQENNRASRAWSLTGSYGSGKSAFALFAAKLFGNPHEPSRQHALELLKAKDNSLYERFIHINNNGKNTALGFCPVLISGERAPITNALLKGLQKGLTHFNGPLPENPILRDIENLLETPAHTELSRASDITAVFELATKYIADSGGTGLLLVIDELGKFLEYAAQHPTQDDVFVLQALAEFAARSDRAPLFLLTILHQRFEAYANTTVRSQRDEWAKIQGRFEDIAFREPTEQLLRLIGSAIGKTPKNEEVQLSVPFIEPSLIPRHLEDDFSQLLNNCLPLHPTVALVIGEIFRQFAQNERSLFAFLNSNEPHGLQEFLDNQYYNGNVFPMFSIPDLYDYLDTTIGNRFYTAREGNKWIEVEMAINQFSDPPLLLVKLIKTIGLLGIVGEVSTNLKPSEKILCYALNDGTEGFKDKFKTALNTLKKGSIVTYRRYNDTYALWEGSDIDIEAMRHQADGHLDPKERLPTYLSELTPPRPLIARRHLFEKGTLRHFAVRHTDLENFNANLSEPLNDADGLVLYALPTDEHEVTAFIEKASGEAAAGRKEVLVAIPHSTHFLRDAVTELACLHWISDNTPELEGDAVARRELSIRSVAAERDVADQLAKIFGGDSDEPCRWFHKGEEININSQRARNEYLSKICDAVYHKTPFIRNELINRRKISGAVTTARRKLIQAMLENGDQENLGITGYPAEMSIYRSLLAETGIHRENAGTWGFYPPKIDDKNQIIHTWKAIEAFLETSEGERQPVVKLYERLMAPPLGVREGPLPILLCAVMQYYRTEIALYENGSFIADWSMPVFERFLKAPEKFELKRFRMTDTRANLLSKFSKALDLSIETETPDLLGLIAHLMQFAYKLPQYTKTTQTLSEAAKHLRTAVFNAREPDELLFKDIPEVLGFSVLSSDSTDSKGVSNFESTLRKALSELGHAYRKLLNTIEKEIKDALRLTGDKDSRRAELVDRTRPLQEMEVDVQLKQFLVRICDEKLDTDNWLEAIGATLAGKPPKSWADSDTDRFKTNLADLARKFRHLEVLTYEKHEHTESPVGERIRISITRPNQNERESVVTLTPAVDEQTPKIEDAIKKVFENLNVDDNPELHIAILARISQQWMQRLDE